MQVTVFGASGRVGQLVVALLADAGYEVTAFVHSQDPFQGDQRVQTIKGDINDAQAVQQAVRGSAAIISTLGSWRTKAKNIVSIGTEHIITAMQAQHVQRIVTVTGSGALATGDKPGLLGKASHTFLQLVAPKILADGEAHLRLLEGSELAWTTIRAPAMTNGSAATYKLDTNVPGLLASIPRQAVAQAMVDQITDQDYLQMAPSIYRR